MIQRDTDVLKVLIKKGGKKVNIMQVSKELKMDYKNTYNIVRRLNENGLITLERFGKTMNCILNKKSHPLIFKAEYERRDETLKKSDMKILYERLNVLPFSFIALLFGSFAKGKAAKVSDIDMMVICEKNRKKEIHRVLSLIPLDIHPVILTHEEFLSGAKTREFNVTSEAIKNNVILIGIEDYYRMISNVG